MDNEQQLTDAFPAVIGFVDQQPKLTIKKLQLKIVPFINANISHIQASIYIATMLKCQPSHEPVFIIQASMNVIGWYIAKHGISVVSQHDQQRRSASIFWQ